MYYDLKSMTLFSDDAFIGDAFVVEESSFLNILYIIYQLKSFRFENVFFVIKWTQWIISTLIFEARFFFQLRHLEKFNLSLTLNVNSAFPYSYCNDCLSSDEFQFSLRTQIGVNFINILHDLWYLDPERCVEDS